VPPSLRSSDDVSVDALRDEKFAMSEQKPKIDLKARLGKKAASSPSAGGSIPPPAGPSATGMPRPSGPSVQRSSAPPYPSGPSQTAAAGIPGPAIPAPPFGAPSRPAAAPRIDPSNPYGAMEAQAVPAARAPQAIRIEIGEEVHEARRRGRKKVLVLALIAAAVGAGVGFTAGGGAERAKGHDAAITGAQDLVKDIEKANTEVQKLADTLKAAKEKLSKGQFPEEEVKSLGAINIPFDGKNLSGKSIGRFNSDVIAMLIAYASSTSDANDQKEKLQNVLTGAKKGIVELLEQRDKPQVRWGVLLTSTPVGPWASMQQLPAPFAAKDKWPEEFKVGSGKQEQVFKRYTSGPPVNDQSPYFIPVDPNTQGAVCPSDVIVRLRRELNDLETVIRGDNSTPGEDKPGMIDAAQKLTQKLKQIGSQA